jgi:hypothetical protein
MPKFISNTVSYLFHPLLLPVYAVMLLFLFPSYLSHYQFEYKKIIILIVFLLTFVIPVSVIMIMIIFRRINSAKLINREERTYPYAVITIIYIVAYYLMLNFPVGIPSVIRNFVLIAAVTVFVCLLINFKIKSSAHMAGLGAFIGYFYIYFLKENISPVLFSIAGINITITFFMIILLIIAGITASSRLSENAHNPVQIGIGFLSGLLIGLSNIFFF